MRRLALSAFLYSSLGLRNLELGVGAISAPRRLNEDVGQCDATATLSLSFSRLQLIAELWHAATAGNGFGQSQKKTVYKKGNLKTGDAQSHFRLPRPLTSMCNLGQHLQQKSITDLREFLEPSMKSIFLTKLVEDLQHSMFVNSYCPLN